MRRWFTLALASVAIGATACGRIAFDPRSDGGLAGDGGDASPDAPACAAFGPWAAPTLIAELSTTADEFGGQIMADGLTLYFDRHNTVPDELFVAKRPDRSSPFGPAQPVAELGTAGSTGSATMSSNGLELFYESSTSGKVCLHRSERSDPGIAWGAPLEVAALCSSPTEGAYLTHDGLSLYYNTATPPTDYEGTIMVSVRASTLGGFGAGNPTGATSGSTSGYPALSSDELAIYFESGGPTDLWEATRPDRSSAWGAASKIAEVDTTAIEQDVSVTADGTEMFFASNRPPSTTLDLFHTTRTCM